MIFQVNVVTITVMALLGAIATVLANQGIAVFHDGLRPIMQQHFQQKIMKRVELLATSFALSIGLVVGFGMPLSITSGVILVHTILLGCDILGFIFKSDKIGMILSAVIGAVFALLVMFGMKQVIVLFEKLPVNFLSALGAVGDPIIVAFVFFPAIAIAYQHGYKKGLISFIVIVLVYQIVKIYGTIKTESISFTLSADGSTLLVGMVIMIVMAIIDKRNKHGSSTASDTFSVFGENIKIIQKNVVYLMISGAIVSAATTLLLIGEGPASLALMAAGAYKETALVSLSRAIGFIPLVMTTAIVAGAYSPSGTKLIFVTASLFMGMGIGGVIGSAVVGAVIMLVEVFLLKYVAIMLDRFPAVKDMGDHIRTAMSKVLELALLLGGLLAAGKMAPTFGYMWVMGFYFLNKTSKKPVTEMAVGPLAAISLGIFINILFLLGLYKVTG